MVLPSYPDDATLQGLAAENNLAETAFLVRKSADGNLRWCTPTVEVPLCGHATLASYRASARGGEIVCRALGDRVELESSCRFYMEGEAEI
jgi:PhzF family phenazine biosynthesis protein